MSHKISKANLVAYVDLKREEMASLCDEFELVALDVVGPRTLGSDDQQALHSREGACSPSSSGFDPAISRPFARHGLTRV